MTSSSNVAAPDTGLTLGDTRTLPDANDKRDRLTLRLSPEARDTLDWISNARNGVTLAEVIRRALGTEKFMIEMQQKGATVLVEEPNKRVKEVVFR